MDGTTGHTLVRVGEFGPLDALSELVHRFYVDGFAERCVTTSRRWAPLMEAAGDHQSLRYLMYSRSIALQQLGRFDEAEETARALLAGLGEDDQVWRAKALAVVAESCTRTGRPGRALSALAEADWRCSTIPRGTYGRTSATMAVALALRSLELFEQADERLSGPEFRAGPEIHVLTTQERAELSVTWAVSLLLTGHGDAGAQFRRTAQLGVLLQRLGAEVGSTAMAARGALFEAYALLRLGHPELAEARAAGVRDAFDHRPELVETQLGRLVHAHTALREGRHGDARALLRRIVEDTRAQGRDVWQTHAQAALAQVDAEEHGETSAVGIWRREAQRALRRLWTEREARFEALRDRESVRRLTAEADRMGRVMLEDPLTGLGNRLMLRATLDSRTRPPAVVFVDVDDFKAVNDRFTHAVGDDVLCRLAHVLRAQCRTDDVVVRYGGDEFLVLTHADGDRAETVAHRVHRAIRDVDWSDLADGLQITVSVGVGRADVGAADDHAAAGTVHAHATAALALADAALLEAKRAGRDRVVSA